MLSVRPRPDHDAAGRFVQRCRAAAMLRERCDDRQATETVTCGLAAVAALCLLLAGASPALAGDDPRPEERGLPAVAVVPTSSLGSSQLFDVAVSGARLYVATLGGLSVFDGAHWTIVESARASYAVAASPRGRVLAGGPDTLAELRRGPDGRLELASLLPSLPAAERGIGDVRSIHAFDDAFLVVTDRQLISVVGSRVRTVAQWASDARRRAFASRGLLFVAHERRLDAFDPDGTPRREALAADATARGRVSFVSDGPTGVQLVAIEGRGMFAVRDGVWQALPQLDSHLGRGIVDATVLGGGATAVATRGGGIVLLTRELTIDRVLGRAEGLPSPLVEALAEDREGGLWAASESALARVDLQGPLSLVDARVGLEGTVTGVLRHRGALHVMTSAGLSVLHDRVGSPRRARLVPGVLGRVWHALPVGDTLLVATSAGVFEVVAGAGHRVPGTAHLSAYVLAPTGDPTPAVLVGSRTGLSTLVRTASGWRFGREVPGAPRYTRSIVARPGGEVVVGSVFDGVVRLSTTGRRAPTRHGAGEVSVREVDGVIEVLQTEPPSLSVLDETTGALTPSPYASQVFGDVVLRVAHDPQGGFWTVGTGAVRVAPGQTTPDLVLDRSVSVQSVDVDAEGVVWLGTGAGLWRYAGAPDRTRAVPAPTLERLIVNGQLVSPWGPNGAALALPFGIERLRLEFSPNTFAAAAATDFRLEPIDTGWSPLRRGHTAEYTSLPEGEYTLQLRPAGGGAAASVWSFTVRPPWYRTPLVRALQIVFVAIAALVLAQVRTARLLRRSRELEAAVTAQTEALRDANRRLAEMASRDDLTGLFNRRHFEAMLAQEWARAHRQRRPIGLVMVDIDHFKRLNDTRGHVAGDAALRQVAGVIAECARRPGDVAARFGGEEFVVLLPGARPDYIHGLAEEIRGAVEQLAVSNPNTPLQYVTVSVGVAAVDAPMQLEPTLVATADSALYRAKEAGRNLVAA